MTIPRWSTDLMLVLAALGGDQFVGTAAAQAPAVVQLPSFSSFGVNTSVSVPDRGSISLGGVGRSSIGSTAYGPAFGRGNRSFGRNLSGSVTSMRATIQDLDALDRKTLRRASAGTDMPRSSADAYLAKRRQQIAGHSTADVQSTANIVPPTSVAEARRQRALDLASGQDEALDNLKRARAASAGGKPRVAATFYRLATKYASGDLKARIEKEAAAAARQPASHVVHHARSPAARRTIPH